MSMLIFKSADVITEIIPVSCIKGCSVDLITVMRRANPAHINRQRGKAFSNRKKTGVARI